MINLCFNELFQRITLATAINELTEMTVLQYHYFEIDDIFGGEVY